MLRDPDCFVLPGLVVWYTVRLRPKRVTHDTQCDLGHVIEPGLCRLYFDHYWLQDPTLTPLSDSLKAKARSRPHSGVPGIHADRARCIPQGRRLRGRIPKLSHLHTAYLSLGTPTSSPILTPYNPKPTVGHRQASLAYTLRGSVASRKVENSEAASPNSVSHRLYYRQYLATGPHFESPSDPLKQATGVHIVDPKHASQAYMLTGPVASHKIEDSEATSPNFASHWLYFHHFWL